MLRILGQKKKQAFCAGMVGKTLEVLLEDDVDDGLRFGFTENYVRVGVASDSTSANEIRSVEIVGVGAGKCIGKTIDHQTEV
jgi:tRNA A37 methylthiotransferase MiaB